MDVLYYVPAVVSLLIALTLQIGQMVLSTESGLATVSNAIRGLFWLAIGLVCLYKAGFF